jgi:FkbM family methyltransferase
MAPKKMDGQEQSAFDHRDYVRLIDSRGDFIRRTVPKLKSSLRLETALDAGAGIGFFVSILEEAGLRTKAFEGRPENVEEARRRYPGIQIQTGDVEDSGIAGLEVFDFVLCFGLLYHLENPLRAIRNLRALTGKALLLESMCIPDAEPWAVLREEPNQEDQSLTDVAFYSSEGLIAKMMYRAGFSFVYSFEEMPDHEDFRNGVEHDRRRTVLLATDDSVSLAGIKLVREPYAADPWQKKLPATARVRRNWKKFLAKTPKERYAAVARMWMRKFPSVPVPVRLPFGAWWLASPGDVDNQLLNGSFEASELRFVEKYLRPGMTVLDVGAHHGLYTLLAARRVGKGGRVIAFEPSERERSLLARHLRLNRCGRVTIENWAVGSERGKAQLFLVEGGEDGCNSLRSPRTAAKSHTTEVEVISLDEYITANKIGNVDFLKLDIEGAELDALKGARGLLTSSERPVVLAEVYEIRSEPWGYKSREIVTFLEGLGYQWHRVAADGQLLELDTDAETFDANLVAVPTERVSQMRKQTQGQVQANAEN